KKKKKKFPILLVLGGLVVVGAVLYFLVFNKKDEAPKEPDYDIRGTWEINWSDIHGSSGNYNMTFSGTKTGGSMLDEFGDPGTYTVSLTNTVVIQYTYETLTFTGTMYSNHNMGGNWTYSTNSGTWNGIKISAKKSDRQNATSRPSQPRQH
ncbi:MAG: hypothetical protein KAT17_08065, partial [Candidatus Aminicenantes bacterium]|nr:hypothetical protein [Candidatus Aminicenantes bacterium]